MSELAHYPPSLVRAWLEARLAAGHSKLSALQELNELRGTRYDSSRLSKWLRREASPDNPETRAHMLRVALPHVLRRHGAPALSDRQLKAIADDLS